MEEEIAPQTTNGESLRSSDFVNMDKETYKRMKMKYQKCKASYIKMKGRPLTDPNEFKRYMKCYIVKNYDKVMNAEGEEATASHSRSFTPEYALNENTGILDIVGVKLRTDESDMKLQTTGEHGMAGMHPKGAEYDVVDMECQTGTFEVMGGQSQTGAFDMIDEQPDGGVLTLETDGEQPQTGAYEILDDQLQIGAYEVVGEQAQPGAFEIVDDQPQTEKFHMVGMQPQSGQLEVISINPQSKHTLEITDPTGKTITYVDLPMLDTTECVPYDSSEEQEFLAIGDSLIQPENLLIKNVEILHYPSTYLITYNRASESLKLLEPPAKKRRQH